jgi:hypothetical protein
VSGLRNACAENRVIAAIHGLEALCEIKAPEKKGEGRKKKDPQMGLDPE